MIRVVICSCHGGFGVSPAALLYLLEKNSPIVAAMPVNEYAGDRVDDGAEFLERCDVPVRDEDWFTDSWSGVLVNKTTNTVYQLTNDYDADDYQTARMMLRTHPDLLDVVEVLGAKEAASRFACLTIVEVPDEDVTVDKLYIDEYDGAEWVAERHRSWS